MKIGITHLDELQSTNTDHEGKLHIGAGVTIARLIAFLQQHTSISDSFDALAKHLQKVRVRVFLYVCVCVCV